MKTIVNCIYFYIQIPVKQWRIQAWLLVDLVYSVIITQIALLYNFMVKKSDNKSTFIIYCLIFNTSQIVKLQKKNLLSYASSMYVFTTSLTSATVRDYLCFPECLSPWGYTQKGTDNLARARETGRNPL